MSPAANNAPGAAVPLQAERIDPAVTPGFAKLWQQHLAATPGATLFSGPDFQAALRRAFAPDGAAQAIAVYRGTCLAGVLPLADLPLARGPLTLRESGFPRNAHTLRNDLLAGSDRTLLAAMFAEWRRGSRTDTLVLENLPHRDDLAKAISQAARAAGLVADPPRPGRLLDFAETEGGYDAYLATRSGQFRRQLRKKRRILEAAGDFEITRLTGAPLREAFPQWRSVVARSWQGAAEAAANTPADWQLHESLAANGALWLARLDGEPIAALRMLEDSRAAYVHTMHFDQDRRELAPGIVLFDAMMRDACARRLPRVDFNGHSDFFARWATGQDARMSIRLYRNSLRGRGARLLRGLGRRGPSAATGADRVSS
ncbi:GNAT family N-acetyltransferase [Acidimangrovimonas pyrenivorans]|uniref:GNAT family N-acetyltransferase n=1 Tax=Acidimangrovimonas pyrenivorans TaxID=2030798 RepID=A0ABV7AH30_9RHOB